jgi:hypothetical protein
MLLCAHATPHARHAFTAASPAVPARCTPALTRPRVPQDGEEEEEGAQAQRASCSGAVDATAADAWSCLPEGLRVSSTLLSNATSGSSASLLESLDVAHQAVLDAARVLSGGAARTGEEAVAAATAGVAALTAAAAAAVPSIAGAATATQARTLLQRCTYDAAPRLLRLG